MEIDELKQYLRRTFIQGNRYIFDSRYDDERLKTTALRYQYFGSELKYLLEEYREKLVPPYDII